MCKNEESGMTDYQYKCMLIDQRKSWETLVKLVEAGDMEAVIQFVEEEIKTIEQKLRV